MTNCMKKETNLNIEYFQKMDSAFVVIVGIIKVHEIRSSGSWIVVELMNSLIVCCNLIFCFCFCVCKNNFLP